MLYIRHDVSDEIDVHVHYHGGELPFSVSNDYRILLICERLCDRDVRAWIIPFDHVQIRFEFFYELFQMWWKFI